MSSPKLQSSLGAPPERIWMPSGPMVTGSPSQGERSPCMRKTGRKQPQANHRARSSRKPGSSAHPPRKPPRSQVHQGIPAMPMESPAWSCSRNDRQVEETSPDQVSAPYFWDPAHAQRTRLRISSCPLFLSPSQNPRVYSRGYRFETRMAGPAA